MSAAEPTTPKVDLNRGVEMARGPDDAYVCMYNDDPGVYFTETLQPLTAERAAAAGFDVEALAKAAELARRLSEADRRVRAELGVSEDEIRAEIDNRPIKELILRSDSPLVIARNQDGVPRETELHLMKHRGQRIWDVIDKVTNEAATDPREEEYALDWMIRQAEDAAA